MTNKSEAIEQFLDAVENLIGKNPKSFHLLLVTLADELERTKLVTSETGEFQSILCRGGITSAFPAETSWCVLNAVTCW